MNQSFSLSLAPRYRLDDELPWLEGIDPSRHYWIAVNSDLSQMVAIPGLAAASFTQFRATILNFRAMQPGDQITIMRPAAQCTIHCIRQNCFAIAAEINHAPVWHLFDQETLESLLMTSHPDWQCSPQDVDLGRRMLMRSWQQTAAA
ncbi:MAG TPA: hypothetical protein V6C64_17785 [Microcoleaceae cyanobacterium]|jgi:hypothetical protein